MPAGGTRSGLLTFWHHADIEEIESGESYLFRSRKLRVLPAVCCRWQSGRQPKRHARIRYLR